MEDHSHGIPDKEKEKIFERFTVSKDKMGTGLGLSMAKFVLNRYSGEIHVEDRVKDDPSKGCVFIIRIPPLKYNG